MKLSFSLLLAVTLLSNFSFSQSVDFNKYQPLQSIGDLPKDFSERTKDKVEAAIKEKITTKDDRNSAKQKSDFLVRSNYMIDNLLMSGNVLFGDPVSDYINKVADIVLKDDPDLRKELRFYCIKSNITNAFTTDQGMIFVSLGLLAQLENEAQLAFILGHEINHYKEDHVINSVIENERIFANERSSKKNRSSDDAIIELSNYSKSLELESDSIGFFFSQTTGYDLEEVLHSFNILQFSHLPYDEIDMDYSIFETEDFIIPEEYRLDSLIAINFEVDEDDSKSTHPNLNKRRDQISEMLKIHGNTNEGVLFQVSESVFNDVRKISRYESIRIDLKNLNFIRAYYNSMYLLKSTPNSSYLQESLAKSLYGIAKFKLNKKYFKFADDHEDYEGSISATYYFFQELEKNAVAVIAIKKIHEINQLNPNEHLSKILENLIENFIVKNDPEDFDFDKYFPLQITAEHIIDGFTEEKEKKENSGISESKYEKLKRLRDKQERKKGIVENTDVDFYRLIFVDYQGRDDIKKIFTKNIELIINEIEKEEEEAEAYRNMNKYELKTYEYNEERNERNRSNIGAESVVFVDPKYYSVEQKKGLLFGKSEYKKYIFQNRLDEVGKRLGVSVSVLSPKLDTANNNLMNHLAICNDWINEINNVNDISYYLDYIPSQSEYMKAISKAYNCDNIAFTGIIDYKHRTQNVLLRLIASVGVGHALAPVSIPLFLIYSFRPKNEFYYYTYIFDAKTGELIVEETYSKKRKADAKINKYMYEMFSKIKINGE